MFQLEPNPTFTAPVAIPVPGQGEATIEVKFKHMGKQGLQAFLDGAKDRTDIDSCSYIVAGWSGVSADYSPEALATLLENYHGAGLAILQAYFRELTGQRVKN